MKNKIDKNIVKTYLNKVGNFDILKREQEVEYAKMIKFGNPKEVKYAIKKFVQSNVKLSHYIAKKYHNKRINLIDLINPGNKGLSVAIEKFDYKRKLKFSTCAFMWIRQKISRTNADESDTIRIPVHMRECENQLEAIENFERGKLNRKPTIKEIYESEKNINENREKILTLKQIWRIKSFKRKKIIIEKSVNSMLDDDNSTVYHDLIGDEHTINPDQHAEQELLRVELEKNFEENLDYKEEIILRMSRGILPTNLEKIKELQESIFKGTVIELFHYLAKKYYNGSQADKFIELNNFDLIFRKILGKNEKNSFLIKIFKTLKKIFIDSHKKINNFNFLEKSKFITIKLIDDKIKRIKKLKQIFKMISTIKLHLLNKITAKITDYFTKELIFIKKENKYFQKNNILKKQEIEKKNIDFLKKNYKKDLKMNINFLKSLVKKLNTKDKFEKIKNTITEYLKILIFISYLEKIYPNAIEYYTLMLEIKKHNLKDLNKIKLQNSTFLGIKEIDKQIEKYKNCNPLKTIAKYFNFTKERIRQIKHSSTKKITKGNNKNILTNFLK